jgi:hypothetical protein
MILGEIATGSVIIGIALITLIGAIMIAAVIRFDIDAVLKMWGALGTLLGLVVGTMGTYFFTKDQIQQKDALISSTQSALHASEVEKANLGSENERLAQEIKTAKDEQLAEAPAETSSTTETTATTYTAGTVTTYEPGKTIVVRSDQGPVQFRSRHRRANR